MAKELAIAVVGCGAIADSYYFPALTANKEWQRAVWLVEPDRKRREQAAAKFGFEAAQAVGTIDELPATTTAAINATPSHLHLATTMQLIERKIGTLVEKPFSEVASEARTMIDSAAGRCLLTANHYRRLCPSYALAKKLIADGEIGEIRQIQWAEGQKFEWPTQSGFYFRRPWKTGRPRGAMLDIGVHVMDQICWWLGTKPAVVSSVMDGDGGPECFAETRLQAPGTEIDVKISFHSKLANQFLVKGSKGSLRGSVTDFSMIEVDRGHGWRALKGEGPAGWTDFAQRIVQNFLAAIEGSEPLIIDPASLLLGLEVIDDIYASAQTSLPACYAEWAA